MDAFTAAASPKGKFLSFGRTPNVGDSVTFEVTGVTERQSVDFHTKEPQFYARSGDAIMEQWISGLDYNAQSEDEANIIFKVDKPLLRQRIGEGITKAGGSSLEPGGVLTVTYVGDGPKKQGSSYPPRDFSVTYTLPEPQDNPWGGAAE